MRSVEGFGGWLYLGAIGFEGGSQIIRQQHQDLTIKAIRQGFGRGPPHQACSGSGYWSKKGPIVEIR
ncbi:MAG: hypothetical protein AXA67_07240 [Methylothermaceae bacteria B42]|nr:MAG: hypothetical protein AXA67_07240 [Methylothermaceae bacteria B42]